MDNYDSMTDNTINKDHEDNKHNWNNRNYDHNYTFILKYTLII